MLLLKSPGQFLRLDLGASTASVLLLVLLAGVSLTATLVRRLDFAAVSQIGAMVRRLEAADVSLAGASVAGLLDDFAC